MLPNASNIHDLPDPGLGDASWGLQADYGAQGIVGRITVISFVRGRYQGFLLMSSTPTTDYQPDAARSAALALSLAGTVESRLPAG